jgi:hypothetical protein
VKLVKDDYCPHNETSALPRQSRDSLCLTRFRVTGSVHGKPLPRILMLLLSMTCFLPQGSRGGRVSES